MYITCISISIAKKNVGTQTECLPRNLAVYHPGCREYLSLLRLQKGDRDTTCVRCEQVEDLHSLVAELKEEAGRLRSTWKCEQYSNSPTYPGERHHVLVGVCYRLPNQDEETDEAFYKQLEEVVQLPALVLMGDFNFPDIF